MKILLIAGARPNFIKIAPIFRAIGRRNAVFKTENKQLHCVLVHTGQHYDIELSEVFFRELSLPSPDINLEVGSASHAVQTANIMERFERVCLREEPDWIVVVGDVNSTMACTLVAAKMGIKVAHVEAGLRSFDRTMPEEINRIVTDSLADLLFTPSADANENLRKEGIPESKIKLVGNIMIDTLVENLEKARVRNAHRNMGLEDNNFVYVTLHRPCNVDERIMLANIAELLNRLAYEIPVVFPVHPRTNKMLRTFGISCTNNPQLMILDPIGYLDSICFAEQAKFVLTDSGGLQEETTFLGTPCLTLRPNTERPVTLTVGSNRLTQLDRLWGDIENILNGLHSKGGIPYLWDGKTAVRVVHHLVATAE
jgi:UDP-N-acetylglucosamine 2-epimerase (non-hydrolysing)